MGLNGTLKYKKTEKEVSDRGADKVSKCNYSFFLQACLFTR